MAEPPEGIEKASASEIVDWATQRFGSRAAFACSFGAEDMVLLDLIARATPRARGAIRWFTLDTGRLFEETYGLMQAARSRYRLPLEIYTPDASELEPLLALGGPNLFYDSVENRKACCRVRKVAPLARALRGSEAWIVGLRREQSTDRASVEKISRDPMHQNLWKICPLADWTDAEVQEYLRARKVPTNPLHSKGFLSIGCAPCTRAVGPGDDPRSGRWWWEMGVKECGLHAALGGGASPAPAPAPPAGGA
ncbi:MAG: phosphoadenylyl-sulfate reductase [Thermoplasmata archaeon]